MNTLKGIGLVVLLALGLSSCIVAHPGYGPRRGGPGWHKGPRHHGGHHHGHHGGRGHHGGHGHHRR